MEKYKNIKILLIPFLFLSLIAVLLLVFHNNRELIMNFIQSFSFIFAGFSVIFASMNRNDDFIFKKKSRTFDIITRWDSNDLLKARSYSREVKENKSKTTDDDLFEHINSRKELKSSVILLSNFGDQIRVGIENSLIDESIIATIAPAMVDILERFKPFFEKYNNNNIIFMEDYKKTIFCFQKCINEYIQANINQKNN